MQNDIPNSKQSLMEDIHNRFHTDGITYLLDLYEALMSSIDREGTLKNFRNNVYVLRQLMQDHYLTAPCFKDLSAARAGERAAFFQPIFDSTFNKHDL